ncbi:MAG TPA: glycosyltransferase [Anaerolineales bacterium]|nr:glycosyltransferase [Anaerolineales bacterium]
MKTIALLYERELDYGGVESHILTLLRRADARSFKFVILAPVSEQFRSKAQMLGAKVIPLLHWSAFQPFFIYKLAKILRLEAVDLAHIHSSIAAIPGRLAALILGLPVIVTVHLPVWLYHGNRQTLKPRLGRRVYISLDKLLNHRATSRLVFVSERFRDQSVAARISPAEASVVIPNGIDLDRFRRGVNRDELRSSYNLSPDTKIVTFIGRLDEEKGLDLLLEAAARLQLVLNGFEVWLVGDGPLKTQLETQSHRLGLEDRVKFWGYQEQIERFLFASDVLALPSHYEAMPVVLLEALAAGTPSVVTQVGDNDLVIENGEQGLVIPPNNVNALVSALHLILTSAAMQRQMSEAAVLRSKDYDDIHMVRQYEALYTELLIKTRRSTEGYNNAIPPE